MFYVKWLKNYLGIQSRREESSKLVNNRGTSSKKEHMDMVLPQSVEPKLM